MNGGYDPTKNPGRTFAVHLACFFGDLAVLKVLHEEFGADFGVRTNKGLTVLHCAAQ